MSEYPGGHQFAIHLTCLTSADEWMECVVFTEFGENVRRAAQKLETRPEEKLSFETTISPFQPHWLMTWLPHVRPVSRFSYGLSTLMTETVIDMLRHTLYLANWKDQGMFTDARWHDPEANGTFFDEIWDAVDLSIAIMAGFRRSEEGEDRIVREFNLISHNPKLPRSKLLQACDYFFNELKPSQLRHLKPQATAAYIRPDPFAKYRPKVTEAASSSVAEGATADVPASNDTSRSTPDRTNGNAPKAPDSSIVDSGSPNGSPPNGM